MLALYVSVQELLRVSEAIGEAKERGLALNDVQHLPCYSQTDRHSVIICVICLDQFTVGQIIRALPCCHEYHAKCVDRWLTVRIYTQFSTFQTSSKELSYCRDSTRASAVVTPFKVIQENH